MAMNLQTKFNPKDITDKLPQYCRRQNDDGTWYINVYWKNEHGTTCRDTLFDELTDKQSLDVLEMIRDHFAEMGVL